LRTSSGLSGKQRGTLTPNIRLCWLDGESMPCARAQTQRDRQADPAKRARLAEDQARIDTVLAETEQ